MRAVDESFRVPVPSRHLLIIEVLEARGLDKNMGSDWAVGKPEDLLGGSDSVDEVDPNQAGAAGDCPSTGGPGLLSLRRIPFELQGRKLVPRQGWAARYSGAGMYLQEQAPHPETGFYHPSDAPGPQLPAAWDMAKAEAGPSADSRMEAGPLARRVKALYTRPAFQACRVGTRRVSCP